MKRVSVFRESFLKLGRPDSPNMIIKVRSGTVGSCVQLLRPPQPTPRHTKTNRDTKILVENPQGVFPDIGLILIAATSQLPSSTVLRGVDVPMGFAFPTCNRRKCPQHVSAKAFCQANALQESTIYKPRTHRAETGKDFLRIVSTAPRSLKN